MLVLEDSGNLIKVNIETQKTHMNKVVGTREEGGTSKRQSKSKELHNSLFEISIR